VRIWDVNTGKELLILQGYPGTIWDLAYSPDGTRLATVGFGGTARVWNATTGKELFNLSGHVGDVVTVAFNPDGSRLATADYDNTVRLWDMNSGAELLNIPGRWQLAFSPDGTRLATGGSNYVRIYLLQIDELVALARSRLVRSWTIEECKTYLHVEACPVAQ
jgi:WD40 repeat protein